MNADDIAPEESILGIPLEYIAVSSPCDVVANVISIPEEPIGNVISLPDTGMTYSINPNNVLVYTSPKSDFEDSLLSESLQTPKIPTIHIEDVCSSPAPTSAESEIKDKDNNTEKQSTVNTQQSEHNYQLAVTDNSNVAPSSLTKYVF